MTSKEEKQKPAQSQAKKKDKSEVQCYKCKQMGHYASECSNKKKKGDSPNGFFEEEDDEEAVYQSLLKDSDDEVGLVGLDAENSDRIRVPVTWGVKEPMDHYAILDTGCPFTIVDAPIFERMEGNPTSMQKAVRGFGGGELVLSAKKKIHARAGMGKGDITVYCANIGKERILLGKKDSQILGVVIQIPPFFPSQKENRTTQEDNCSWLMQKADPGVEVQCSPEETAVVEEVIKSILEKNSKLSAKSTSSLEGSKLLSN